MTREEILLSKVAEEALELAHRAMKTLHYGKSEVQEGQEETNLTRLRGEYIDLHVAMQRYVDHIDILVPAITREEIDEAKKKQSIYLELIEQNPQHR